MFPILKTTAHSNAKEPPIKRQRHLRFYWVSPKCFTTMVLSEIQICEVDLQFDLYFRFRSMSFICSPAESGGVQRDIVISMYHGTQGQSADQRKLTAGSAALISITHVCEHST